MAVAASEVVVGLGLIVAMPPQALASTSTGSRLCADDLLGRLDRLALAARGGAR